MSAPKRKNVRLPHWDYASRAWYFLTLCCLHQQKTFGEIAMRDDATFFTDLTEVGRACEAAIERLAENNDAWHVERFAIMPNHVHLIVSSDGPPADSPDLSGFVHFLKSAITRRARTVGLEGPLWQKGFYEHVIRDERDYDRIVEYVESNPAKWAEDKYFL